MDPNDKTDTELSIRFEPLLLFLVFYLPGYLLQSDHIGGRIFDSVGFNLTYLLQTLPRIALLLYIILLRSRIERPGEASRKLPADFGIGRLRTTDIAWAALIVVAIEVIIVPLVILGRGISAQGYGFAAVEVHWQLRSPTILPLVFLTSMTAGYSEELFFRSYLLTTLPRMGVGVGTAVAAGSTLFALGHLYEGIIATIGALLIGVILSLIFLWKRNIHMIAIAHGLYNFITLLATLSRAGSLS